MKEKRIYFLRPVGEVGPIKIGCSAEPQKRLRSVEIWSPVVLEIVATAPGEHAHESVLHQMFGDDRLHGEWFTHSDRLGRLIAHVSEHGSLPPLDMKLRPYVKRKEGGPVKSVMTRRANSVVTQRKHTITASVLRAERRAFGFMAHEFFRPVEIDQILDEQKGFWAAPVSGAELTKLNKYIADLQAMPAAPRDMRAWAKFRELVLERAA